MNKQEITSKIKEITETGAVCGVDVYVCLKGEEQGFYIEKMISMNSLKDRIRSIALEIINTQYLQDEVVYCDILDVIDNKKAVYVLEQSDEYKPFALLNDDSMDEVFNFDEKDIGNVLADCRQSPRLFAGDFSVLKRLKVSIFKTFQSLFGIIKVSKKAVLFYDDTRNRKSKKANADGMY